jgi:hypothetical protein
MEKLIVLFGRTKKEKLHGNCIFESLSKKKPEPLISTFY